MRDSEGDRNIDGDAINVSHGTEVPCFRNGRRVKIGWLTAIYHGLRTSMRILLTAFEPYDHWEKNSGWETLVAYLSERGAHPKITTRRYPVDLIELQARLEFDLAQGIDAVLHLGQAPGIDEIRCEAVALNVAGIKISTNGEYGPILENAPVAYRTQFPVGEWVQELKSIKIPASVSYHAGTYLCNAAMFLSHQWFSRRQESAWVGMLHLPLTPEQANGSRFAETGMPTHQMSKALHCILDRILAMRLNEPLPIANNSAAVPTSPSGLADSKLS